MKCKNMAYIFIFTLAITGVLFMLNSNAYAQGCSGEIVKVANPADDTPFQFNFFNGQIGQIIEMSDPSFNSIFLGLDIDEFITVSEQVTTGWVLQSIECEASGPVSFNISNTSVTINCNGNGAMIRCEFNNVTLNPVPTISEWGLIAMASILGVVGFMVVRRRKVTA